MPHEHKLRNIEHHTLNQASTTTLCFQCYVACCLTTAGRIVVVHISAVLKSLSHQSVSCTLNRLRRCTLKSHRKLVYLFFIMQIQSCAFYLCEASLLGIIACFLFFTGSFLHQRSFPSFLISSVSLFGLPWLYVPAHFIIITVQILVK